MDSRLRENDKDQSPRCHGFPSFPQNAPRHSRVGGNPLGITVIHTEVLFLNQPNLPCLSPFFQIDLIRGPSSYASWI